MSRRLIAALATALMVPFFVVAHSSGLKPDGQVGPILGKPLSGIEERHNEQIMNDGTRADRPSSGLFYRDEKGRMRVESQTKVVIYDPTIGQMFIADIRSKTYRKMNIQPTSPISIVVVEDGIWISSETPGLPRPATNLKTPLAQARTNTGLATPLTPASSAAPTPPAAQEDRDPKASREDLPSVVIAGLQVQGSRMTSVIPAGAVGNDHELKSVSERWYSDDIKALVRSSASDPRFGALKYELTNISQAPPDPALFQLPAGFALITDKDKGDKK